MKKYAFLVEGSSSEAECMQILKMKNYAIFKMLFTYWETTGSGPRCPNRVFGEYLNELEQGPFGEAKSDEFYSVQKQLFGCYVDAVKLTESKWKMIYLQMGETMEVYSAIMGARKFALRYLKKLRSGDKDEGFVDVKDVVTECSRLIAYITQHRSELGVGMFTLVKINFELQGIVKRYMQKTLSMSDAIAFYKKLKNICDGK